MSGAAVSGVDCGGRSAARLHVFAMTITQVLSRDACLRIVKARGDRFAIPFRHGIVTQVLLHFPHWESCVPSHGLSVFKMTPAEFEMRAAVFEMTSREKK